jgi:hypothetical protein
MTGTPLRARRVLDDCKRASELLDDAEEPSVRRVLWVATIALLRAVGHVLDKADRQHNPFASAAIDELWGAFKIERERHQIFWSFIESERNAVLKQYEFGFSEEPIVVLLPDGSTHTVPLDLFLPSTSVDGEDARELVSEALAWWNSQLCRVEQLMADRAQGT